MLPTSYACLYSVFLFSFIKPLKSLSILSEETIDAVEFQEFNWDITLLTIQEKVDQMVLSRTMPSGEVKNIISYNLDEVTRIQYHEGYSAKDVVVRVDDKEIDNLRNPQIAMSALTTGVIYHFGNPKVSDSGTYTFEVKGNRVDSGKAFMYSRKIEIIVEQPASPNLVQIPASGRLGFPLQLPCSLLAEQQRSEAFSAVFWRKGAYLSSSKLITQWRRFRNEPDFPVVQGADSPASRYEFTEATTDAIFETSYDASLKINALKSEDFDNWWCEIEFNQDETLLVYKVTVVPDHSPSYNGTRRDSGTVSLFENLEVLLEAPYRWIILGSIGAVVVIIIAACICIYCILSPNDERKQRKRQTLSNQPQRLHPIAKRISHVSIVPCEICQENAIECFAMPCGHTYCDDCLDRLISTGAVCIFCKRIIDKKQKLYNRIEEHDFL